MNKSIAPLIAVGVFLTVATPALAVLSPNINVRQTNTIIQQTVSITVTPTVTPKTTISIKPIKNIEIKLPLRKTNALKEIERRMAGLDKLSDKIQGTQRITEKQRETLLAQVKIEISKLEELKTKINAETDATALKGQKQSIIDSYKIFSLYIPKIEIIAHADKIITIAAAMDAKTDDASLKKIIAESSGKAQSAIDLVIGLIPEGDANKTTMQTARDMLREARTNLNTVYNTLKSE